MKIISQLSSVILSTLLIGTTQASIDTQQSIMRLKVESDGIYRLYYSDILAMGIDINGVAISNIAITNNGENIPVKVVSEDQQTFGPNGYIDFVGEANPSLYQIGSVYSLVLTSNLLIQEPVIQPKINQQALNQYMHKDIYAPNSDYSFGSPVEDPWFAKRLLAIGSEVSENLEFTLDNLINEGQIELAISIWGGTDYLQSPDHHVIYEVNGNTVDDFRFDGITAENRFYQMDTNAFTSGTHDIVVKVPNDTNTPADVIHIESWQVSYPRSLSLINKQLSFSSDDQSTVKMGDTDLIFAHGFEVDSKHFKIDYASNESYIIYHAKSNDTVMAVDYLQSGNCQQNISVDCTLHLSTEHSSGQIYISAESSLLRPELSLPVVLTDIKEGSADYLIITHPDFMGDDLDEFVTIKQQNHNVKLVDVEQIYAQYGYSNVSAQSIDDYIKYSAENLGTRNVLLVGGDSYDYNNYLGLDSVSYIPTIYGSTDDLITYAPIDAKFADVNDDNVPDINIGRFPVRTDTELRNLINKVIAYGEKNYAKTAVFAADKYDVSNAYSFKNDAQFLIDLLPIEWQNNIGSDRKAFIDDDGLALAKAKIIDNINQGVALTSFIGHSGPRDWSFSRLFSASDANSLVNDQSPTLVTQWGCWNTYFVSPTEDTLAHAFMLNNNGGAASVLGASTLTKAEHERGLAELVLTYLTHEEMSLGDAVTRAKQTYAQNNPNALDVILGWNILGDPSLKL